MASHSTHLEEANAELVALKQQVLRACSNIKAKCSTNDKLDGKLLDDWHLPR